MYSTLTHYDFKEIIYLKKFLFCDSIGDAVDPVEEYTVVGYKKRVIPLAW